MAPLLRNFLKPQTWQSFISVYGRFGLKAPLILFVEAQEHDRQFFDSCVQTGAAIRLPL